MAADGKFRVAMRSFQWAILLTTTKLIAGIITGSLGILSEALHSGLDLVAAGVTVYAVSASSRPADAEHQFGHGKFENLSALFETILLVATSAWIIWEAVERLAGEGPDVTVTSWSFGVMAFSIWVVLYILTVSGFWMAPPLICTGTPIRLHWFGLRSISVSRLPLTAMVSLPPVS